MNNRGMFLNRTFSSYLTGKIQLESASCRQRPAPKLQALCQRPPYKLDSVFRENDDIRQKGSSPLDEKPSSTEKLGLIIGVVLLAMSLNSCKERTITETWIEKESPKPIAAVPEAPMEISLQWTVPTTWKEVTPSSMRVASFLFKEYPAVTLDMSVVRLSGDGGGQLANVNRWRGQLQLNSITEEQLRKEAVIWEVDHHPLMMTDYTGPNKIRMLAAIYTLDQESWYFKMTGNTEVVEQAKPSFIEFVKSIRTGHAH